MKIKNKFGNCQRIFVRQIHQKQQHKKHHSIVQIILRQLTTLRALSFQAYDNILFYNERFVNGE